MSFRFTWPAAVVLPLLLAACASIAPPATQQESTRQTAPARSFHEAIDLSGRLSVRYQRNNKEETLHGSFVWNQSAAQTTVTLLSPLGQTLAVITVTAAGATLAQAGQPVRDAADVNTLTAQTLGWPLPVDGLRDWLQGFATERSGKRIAAAPHPVDIVTGDGWQIRYANWLDDGTQQIHPKRIDLARSTEQAGDVSIRIVIDTWQAH